MIDRSLESLVFLFNASEGNYGIYDLLGELGRYHDETTEEKRVISSGIILELCQMGYTYIQTYLDFDFKNKGERIDNGSLETLLRDVQNWKPNSMPLPCLEITPVGEVYLDQAIKLRKSEFEHRILGIGKGT